MFVSLCNYEIMKNNIYCHLQLNIVACLTFYMLQYTAEALSFRSIRFIVFNMSLVHISHKLPYVIVAPNGPHSSKNTEHHIGLRTSIVFVKVL